MSDSINVNSPQSHLQTSLEQSDIPSLNKQFTSHTIDHKQTSNHLIDDTNHLTKPLKHFKPQHSNTVEGRVSNERKDRKGKEIRKGSKIHHITFKDEVTGDQSEKEQKQQQEENDDNDIREKELIMSGKKKGKHREPLYDVYYVESYKEYNATNPEWNNQQCCRIL